MSYDPIPGMRVVCVRGYRRDPRCYGDEALPSTGSVYTIRDVGIDELSGDVILLLAEIINAERVYEVTATGAVFFGEPWWRAQSFRPLDERRIDVFRQHLAPAPKDKVPA